MFQQNNFEFGHELDYGFPFETRTKGWRFSVNQFLSVAGVLFEWLIADGFRTIMKLRVLRIQTALRAGSARYLARGLEFSTIRFEATDEVGEDAQSMAENSKLFNTSGQARRNQS